MADVKDVKVAEVVKAFVSSEMEMDKKYPLGAVVQTIIAGNKDKLPQNKNLYRTVRSAILRNPNVVDFKETDEKGKEHVKIARKPAAAKETAAAAK